MNWLESWPVLRGTKTWPFGAVDVRQRGKHLHRCRIPKRLWNLIVGERQPGGRVVELWTCRRAVGKVALPLGRSGDVSNHLSRAVRDARALPAAEEERAVLSDRTAPKPAVLVALEEVLLCGEEALRVERAIAQVLERSAMEAVRPGARDDVHDGARIVAMRRAVVRRLNREFLECVGKREALVFLEIRIGVVGAVQPVRVLALAGAVGRNADRARDRLAGLLADRRQHGARDQRLQPRDFAAGDRQLDDARVVDDLADGCRRDVDRRRFARDRDRFRQITELERDVHREILVRLQRDIRAAHRLEARQLRANLIGGRSNRWERVAPIGAGDRVGLDACGALDGRHRGAGNHASAAVGKGPVDLSRALRKRV